MAPSLELLEQPAEYVPVKAIPAHGHRVAPAHPELQSPETHQRVMDVFRAFIADLAQQYGEGHAG